MTATLPAGGFSGQLAAVKMISTASSHTVAVTPTAPDVIGRATGWTSGSYSTSATLSLSGQGSLVVYNAAGTPASVTLSTSSANMTISTSTTPFAAGQLVYFTASSTPGGLTMSVPYYVISTSGPTGGTFTFQVSATSTGTGITPSSTGSSVFVQTCGNWTTISDDLPLAQLDSRYLQLAGGTMAGNIAMGGSGVTGLGNGSAATDACAYGQLLSAEPATLPSDTAAPYLAWSFDPMLLNGQSTLNSGQLYLIRVNVRQAVSCTGVVVPVAIAAAAGTLTSNESFAGLYSSAGTLVGTTADQSGVWTTNGVYAKPLTGGPYSLSAGFYWVAMLCNNNTGNSSNPAPPRTGTGPTDGTVILNAGFGASTARFGTYGSSQTSLPGSITTSSISLFGNAIWGAIY